MKRKIIGLIILISSSAYSATQNWFQTWDRPDYIEWAKPSDKGYSLFIIIPEPDNILMVKADLIMQERGLPDFKVISTENVSDLQQALDEAEQWKSE